MSERYTIRVAREDIGAYTTMSVSAEAWRQIVQSHEVFKLVDKALIRLEAEREGGQNL